MRAGADELAILPVAGLEIRRVPAEPSVQAHEAHAQGAGPRAGAWRAAKLASSRSSMAPRSRQLRALLSNLSRPLAVSAISARSRSAAARSQQPDAVSRADLDVFPRCGSRVPLREVAAELATAPLSTASLRNGRLSKSEGARPETSARSDMRFHLMSKREREMSLSHGMLAEGSGDGLM